MTPWWYGRFHPKLKDLVSFGDSLGAAIHIAPAPAAAFIPGDPSVVIVPNQHGPLSTLWTLAHELGHLCQHVNQDGALHWHSNEHKANQWAASAILPKQRVLSIGQLCLDDLVDHLSMHYEYLHQENHDAKKLARKIAKIRLHSIKEDVWKGYEINQLMR